MTGRPDPTTPGALGARLAARNPALATKLRQMALPLAPLVQLTTGAVHPAFPQTLLGFWLLTDAQLEALAAFYHQRVPCRWTAHYPCPVAWRSDLPLEEKRRKMGKFIGLRGCDTPASAVAAAAAAAAAAALGRDRDRGRGRADPPTEEEIVEEARRARLAEDEDGWRRKLGWQ